MSLRIARWIASGCLALCVVIVLVAPQISAVIDGVIGVPHRLPLHELLEASKNGLYRWNLAHRITAGLLGLIWALVLLRLLLARSMPQRAWRDNGSIKSFAWVSVIILVGWWIVALALGAIAS